MSAVSSYRDAASKLDDGYFLGQIVSYTICETDVQLDNMHGNIKALGLREGIMKGRIRRVDAFKRAANDIQTRFSRLNGKTDSILVRDVGQDEAEAHRHIVLEEAVQRTGEPRAVKYTTLFKLMYDRGVKDEDRNWVNDSVYVEDQGAMSLLHTEGRQWIDSTIGTDGAALKARFDHYSTHVDANAIRVFVREYIHALNGVNIKGGNAGGLYFVNQKHAEEIRKLAELVRSIGSEMHLIPLLDIVDQRDHIAKAFVDDTLEEIRSLDGEIQRILDVPSRHITAKTYDDFLAKATALMEKNSEYKNLLDNSLDLADMEVNVFRSRVLALNTRIKYPKSFTR